MFSLFQGLDVSPEPPRDVWLWPSVRKVTAFQTPLPSLPPSVPPQPSMQSLPTRDLTTRSYTFREMALVTQPVLLRLAAI